MERTSVHSNQFIVASVDSAGNFSINVKPHIHVQYQDAVQEARRLASLVKGKKFVVLAIAAVAKEITPVVTNVVVEYEL